MLKGYRIELPLDSLDGLCVFSTRFLNGLCDGLCDSLCLDPTVCTTVSVVYARASPGAHGRSAALLSNTNRMTTQSSLMRPPSAAQTAFVRLFMAATALPRRTFDVLSAVLRSRCLCSPTLSVFFTSTHVRGPVPAKKKSTTVLTSDGVIFHPVPVKSMLASWLRS